MKLENIEKKIYEILGIKIFKKLAISLLESILFATDYIIAKVTGKNLTIEEIVKRIKSQPKIGISNYRIKKGIDLQNLRNFKNKLLFNSSIHIICIILIILRDLSNPLLSTVFIILNLYCIMLQRYNLVRINNVVKRFENKEKKEKDKLKEEIKNEEITKELTHKIGIIFNEKKEITLEEFLNFASLSDLKEYKKALIYFKNQTETYPSIILTNDKSLKLSLKK